MMDDALFEEAGILETHQQCPLCALLSSHPLVATSPLLISFSLASPDVTLEDLRLREAEFSKIKMNRPMATHGYSLQNNIHNNVQTPESRHFHSKF
jgi:hypothetical protein